MNSLRSAIPLAVLIALTTSNLILIQGISAVAPPTVPEFSVKFIPNSYSVTTTDPYTDQTTTMRNLNNTLQVTIKNQPAIDSTHQIYYNIRVRPHFEGNWTELYPLWTLATEPYNWETETWKKAKYLYIAEMPERIQTPKQSNKQETIITLTLNENSVYPLSNLPDNAQIDFQVQAVIGHSAQCWATQHALYPEYGGYYEDAVAYDGSSDWSSTQTVTVPSSSATAQPSATTESPSFSGAPIPADSMQVNDLVIIILSVSAVIIVAIIAVAAVLIKKAKTHVATAAPNYKRNQKIAVLPIELLVQTPQPICNVKWVLNQKRLFLQKFSLMK
jgi:hypothetical protein